MALASYGFVCLSFLSFATADTDYRNLTDLVDYVYLNCSKDTIAGTVFQSNLKTLLWILSNNATTETGFNKTTVKYVTESTALNDEQCTQDLSSDDCVGCLTDINGRILYPSCNIRFQLFPFYRAHADPPQRPAPSSLQGKPHSVILLFQPFIIPFYLVKLFNWSQISYENLNLVSQFEKVLNRSLILISCLNEVPSVKMAETPLRAQ